MICQVHADTQSRHTQSMEEDEAQTKYLTCSAIAELHMYVQQVFYAYAKVMIVVGEAEK